MPGVRCPCVPRLASVLLFVRCDRALVALAALLLFGGALQAMADHDDALWHAVMTQDVDAAAHALAHGADANRANPFAMTPLIVACAGMGPVPMLDLLLRHGARHDVRDQVRVHRGRGLPTGGAAGTRGSAGH